MEKSLHTKVMMIDSTGFCVFICFCYYFPLSLRNAKTYIPTDIGLIVMNSIGKNKLYTHTHTHKNIDRHSVSCFQRPSVNKRTENILYNLAFHDNFSATILWPVAVKAKRSPLPFDKENQFEHFFFPLSNRCWNWPKIGGFFVSRTEQLKSCYWINRIWFCHFGWNVSHWLVSVH